jgi:MFS transporter, DHA2 family, multidrug resistance protein
MSISLASFSLFGASFAMTQLLQDAHGYSALEAGAAMTPLALGLVLGAGSSMKLVERVGTTRVVTAGLLGLTALLVTSLLWTADMPYAPIGLWFFGVALTLGWIMGPATDSVMGSVPEEKSGVGSAMNDVTPQVAGALTTSSATSSTRRRRGARSTTTTRSRPATRRYRRASRASSPRRSAPRRPRSGTFSTPAPSTSSTRTATPPTVSTSRPAA